MWEVYKIESLDTKENREKVIDAIINREFMHCNLDVQQNVRKRIEKLDLLGLLTFNIDALRKGLREDYIIAIIALYKAEDKFADAFEFDHSFKNNVYDYLSNLSTNELSTFGKGYSVEYVSGFENMVKSELGVDVFSNKTFFIDVKLGVYSKHLYSFSTLSRRCHNRVGYKWDEANIEDLHLTLNEPHRYELSMRVKVEGTSPYTAEMAMDRIKFRFGSTSGRPWNSCHVLDVNVVE